MSPPPAKKATPDKPVQEQPQPPPPEPEPDRTILPAEEPEPAPPEPEPDPEPQPQETVEEPPTQDDSAEANEEGTSTDPGDPNDRLGPVRITGFDDPNFNYGYYIDRMLEAIRSQWLRPPVGNDVESVVHFYIRADGAIEALEMVEPSGVTSFDMAGMRAIRSARLPPLPRSYRRQRLGVTLIFR
jgi:outer membrane biosynthesis protein TonB